MPLHTHDKGISSLSIHCAETALSQIWINLSSVLHSFPPPKPVYQLFACSATVYLGVVLFGAENSCLVSAKMQSVFTADCSVYGMHDICYCMLFTSFDHFKELFDILANTHLAMKLVLLSCLCG